MPDQGIPTHRRLAQRLNGSVIHGYHSIMFSKNQLRRRKKWIRQDHIYKKFNRTAEAPSLPSGGRCFACHPEGNRRRLPVYLFFFAFQIIIFASVLMLFYVIYPEGNRLLINNTCLLLMIGMIILTRLSYDKAVKQFFIVTASFIIGFFIPEVILRFDYLKKLYSEVI